MNENMNRHEEERLKSEECWWDEIGKTAEPQENPQKFQNAHYNYPPDDTETRILDSSRVGKINNRERKNNRKWLYT